MENTTFGGGTDFKSFMEYKVSIMMWKVVPLFILVLGTFGNMATILVMSRIKDNNSSQYAIIMVLAMADLCLLYSGCLHDWLWFCFNVSLKNPNIVLCKLGWWTVYASGTTSAWLVTTVTVQRTMAVLWPHRMRTMCTMRRTRVVIAVVVITAWSVHFHAVIGYERVDEKYCYITGKYEWFVTVIWNWVDMCLSSSVPSVCLFVCSVILARSLSKSTSLSSTAVRATSNVKTGHSHDSRKSNATKATVMILALSCAFFVLTLPVCIYVIWRVYGSIDSPKTEALSMLFSTLVFLMWYGNSAVNFLLYCITGTRFREEFLSLLRYGMKGHTAGETTARKSSGDGSKRQNSTPLSAELF